MVDGAGGSLQSCLSIAAVLSADLMMEGAEERLFKLEILLEALEGSGDPGWMDLFP